MDMAINPKSAGDNNLARMMADVKFRIREKIPVEVTQNMPLYTFLYVDESVCEVFI
jgi:glutathione peroxidase-family protein